MANRNDGVTVTLAVTPAASGAMVMVVTNVFAQLGFNPLATCFVLSALFGLSVFALNGGAPDFRRVFLWFVASITIFTSAIGTNELGRGASGALTPRAAVAEPYDECSFTPVPTPVPTPQPTPFFRQWVK